MLLLSFVVPLKLIAVFFSSKISLYFFRLDDMCDYFIYLVL